MRKIRLYQPHAGQRLLHDSQARFRVGAMARQWGKAQPLDSQVLAPTGWRRFGDLAVGDMVIGGAGQPVRVAGIYSQGLRPVFRVYFSDGAATRCCEEHLWTVRWRKHGHALRHETVSLRELMARGLHTPRSGRKIRERRFFIPLVRPVMFAPAVGPLPLAPYLLGLLLGDGCFRPPGPAFSSADPELQTAVRTLLPPGVFLDQASGYNFRITTRQSGHGPNPVRRILQMLGLDGTSSATKFVPTPYLLASPDDRLALLQGLLDTDAYVDPDRNKVEYTTVSPRLARDVRFLVCSLGGTLRTSLKHTTGQLAYRINIAMPSGVPLFRLGRKARRYRPHVRYEPTRSIEAVEHLGDDDVQCITVDAEDGLYVTDDFIVTHNSLACVNEAAKFAWEHPGSVTWWVAPTYSQATDIGFQGLVRGFGPRPGVTDDWGAFMPGGINRSSLRLTWENGSVTACKSTERPENLRGRRLDFLILDECARMPRIAWQEILRPMLATTGGHVIFISTPRGRRNWFHELYLLGQDPLHPDYESWNFPSAQNPYVHAACDHARGKCEIEEARATTSADSFKQEFMAEFLEDGGEVFRNVTACIEGEYDGPAPQNPAHHYVLGWDVGMHQDPSVVIGLDVTAQRVVLFDRFLGLDYPLQAERVAHWSRSYSAKVLMDSTHGSIGDPMCRQLQDLGVTAEPFQFTNKSKGALVEHLVLRLEERAFTFPRIPVLIGELEAFQREMTPSGVACYGAPDGQHDDTVVALALAVWAGFHGGGLVALYQAQYEEMQKQAEKKGGRAA